MYGEPQLDMYLIGNLCYERQSDIRHGLTFDAGCI